MPKKEQENIKEFSSRISKFTKKAFVNAVGGEKKLADTALLQFAKEQLIEEEHDKITEIQKSDTKRFMQIVTVLALENPDRLGKFLHDTKTAYKNYNKDNLQKKK